MCEEKENVCVSEKVTKNPVRVYVCVCVSKYCEKGSGLNPRGTAETTHALISPCERMELCILHSDRSASACLFVERIPGGHLVWCCLGLQEAVAWIFYRAATMHFWWLLAQILPSLFHKADDCTYSVPVIFLHWDWSSGCKNEQATYRAPFMFVHQNAGLKFSEPHGIKQQRFYKERL